MLTPRGRDRTAGSGDEGLVSRLRSYSGSALIMPVPRGPARVQL